MDMWYIFPYYCDNVLMFTIFVKEQKKLASKYGSLKNDVSIQFFIMVSLVAYFACLLAIIQNRCIHCTFSLLLCFAALFFRQDIPTTALSFASSCLY